jgi:hypothetical protein
MEIKSKLEEFLKLLHEENRALIYSFTDEKEAKKLEDITKKKEKILVEILNYTKEDIEPYVDILKEIESINERNKKLAINAIDFAEDIFSTLFPQEEQNYSPNGEVEKKASKNLINKKV